MLEIWEDIFDLSYTEWFSARLYVLNRTERKLSGKNIVSLELIETEESFCEYCGKIDNKYKFSNIKNKIDKKRRVCEQCGETYNEFRDEVDANKGKSSKTYDRVYFKGPELSEKFRLTGHYCSICDNTEINIDGKTIYHEDGLQF
jgi:hypothetical protein